MTITPGRDSSEYWKALRAEAFGTVLAWIGVVVALTAQSLARQGIGVVLLVVGAWVVTRALESYAASRGGVKAAAVRRPVDTAPRGGL